MTQQTSHSELQGWQSEFRAGLGAQESPLLSSRLWEARILLHQGLKLFRATLWPCWPGAQQSLGNRRGQEEAWEPSRVLITSICSFLESRSNQSPRVGPAREELEPNCRR